MKHLRRKEFREPKYRESWFDIEAAEAHLAGTGQISNRIAMAIALDRQKDLLVLAEGVVDDHVRSLVVRAAETRDEMVLAAIIEKIEITELSPSR